MSQSTMLPDEIQRFDEIADGWWDSQGKFKPLHQINPCRLDFITSMAANVFNRSLNEDKPFKNLTLLDIGCGGGLLSEPLARLGFHVTGIDAGEKNIAIASSHAKQSGLTIDYRVSTPENIADETFDCVCAMEVIEHVAHPSEFIAQASRLLKKDGLFFGSTLNRTPKSWLFAIVGAEYILRWLPVGTHDWRKFLKPSEFSDLLRRSTIDVQKIEGLHYQIFTDRWERHSKPEINYHLYGIKR